MTPNETTAAELVCLVDNVIRLRAAFFFKVEDARLHGLLVTLLPVFMGLVIFMIFALDRPMLTTI